MRRNGFVYSADCWRTSGTEEERLREGPARQRRLIQFESKDRGALPEDKNYVLVNFIHFGTQTMRHTSRNQELLLSSASTLDDERWAAFVARDASRDGQFYVAVETTGIYCRPSCPARRPKRANVRFHETAAEAEAAGFRPCKRCKPDQLNLVEQRAAKVAEA